LPPLDKGYDLFSFKSFSLLSGFGSGDICRLSALVDVPRNSSKFLNWTLSEGSCVLNFANPCGKDQAKGGIEILYKSGLRPEVSAKLKEAYRYVAKDFELHGIDKALDAGLTKEVDRLFWISNEKERLTVTVPPTC